jgi:hypothetical protein
MTSEKQYKCGFCKESGHCIKTCHNPKAVELIEATEFKFGVAIQYFDNEQYSTQLLNSIINWLEEKSISELTLLISNTSIYKKKAKKEQLIAGIIIGYYCWDAYNDWTDSKYYGLDKSIQTRLNKLELYWRLIYTGHKKEDVLEEIEKYKERDYRM